MQLEEKAEVFWDGKNLRVGGMEFAPYVEDALTEEEVLADQEDEAGGSPQ